MAATPIKDNDIPAVKKYKSQKEWTQPEEYSVGPLSNDRSTRDRWNWNEEWDGRFCEYVAVLHQLGFKVGQMWRKGKVKCSKGSLNNPNLLHAVAAASQYIPILEITLTKKPGGLVLFLNLGRGLEPNRKTWR